MKRITIICSKEDAFTFKATLNSDTAEGLCPFSNVSMAYCDNYNGCDACLEQNIEFKIREVTK